MSDAGNRRVVDRLNAGDACQAVFILEFRNGLTARETACWSKPFPVPKWRARWVERASE